jgi:hypothetical protein
MIEAVMLWNEPNNKSHWDIELDGDTKPDWLSTDMACLHGEAVNRPQCRLSVCSGRTRYRRRRRAGALGARPRSHCGRPPIARRGLCWLANRRQAARHGSSPRAVQRRRVSARSTTTSDLPRGGAARVADRRCPLSWSRFCRILASPWSANLVTLHLSVDHYPPEALSVRHSSRYFNCVSVSQKRSFPEIDAMLPEIPNGVGVAQLQARHAKRQFALALGRITGFRQSTRLMPISAGSIRIAPS